MCETDRTCDISTPPCLLPTYDDVLSRVIDGRVPVRTVTILCLRAPGWKDRLEGRTRRGEWERVVVCTKVLGYV